jgi:hypothetical protein
MRISLIVVRQQEGGRMRSHSFMDREFGRPDYDPDDQGDFVRDLVFIIMPFSGADSADVLSAVKDECAKLELHAKRVDENVGSGLVLAEITKLIEDAQGQRILRLRPRARGSGG